MASEESATDGERTGEDKQPRSVWVDALIGAVVTVLTAFIPFSPVLGGGVAGYLHRGDDRAALKVGALAGLLASVPVLAIFGLIVLVVFVGVAVTGEVAVPLLVVGVMLVLALFVLAYTVVLSAVGGVIGRALARRERQGPAGAEEG